MNASPDTSASTAGQIARMGQQLFGHLAPNGWPETGDQWINAGSLLDRINFGVQRGQRRTEVRARRAVAGMGTAFGDAARQTGRWHRRSAARWERIARDAEHLVQGAESTSFGGHATAGAAVAKGLARHRARITRISEAIVLRIFSFAALLLLPGRAWSQADDQDVRSAIFWRRRKPTPAPTRKRSRHSTGPPERFGARTGWIIRTIPRHYADVMALYRADQAIYPRGRRRRGTPSDTGRTSRRSRNRMPRIRRRTTRPCLSAVRRSRNGRPPMHFPASA